MNQAMQNKIIRDGITKIRRIIDGMRYRRNLDDRMPPGIKEAKRAAATMEKKVRRWERAQKNRNEQAADKLEIELDAIVRAQAFDENEDTLKLIDRFNRKHAKKFTN